MDVLQAASRVLRDANRTSQVLVPVLEAVARALRCDLAETWLVEPNGRRMSLLVDWCGPIDHYPVLRRRHARTSFDRGEGLVGRAWMKGRAVGERRGTPARGLPPRSWAAPVTVGGSVCAVLAFHGDEGDPDDPSILSGLEAVASQAGATIERIEMQRLAAVHELGESSWLDTTPEAVAVIDHQGRVQQWSGTAARLLGYPASSVAGRDLVTLLAPRRWQRRYRRAMARSLSGRPDWLERRIEAPVLGGDGQERVLELTLARVHRERVPSLVLHARDVTEARADRLALRRARARAEGETRSRDDFLAMLAHELRTPLTPIVATLELLDPTDPAGVEQARDMLRRHATDLTRVLDDLIDVARAARGKLTVARGPVRIRDVIERASEMVDPLITTRQQRLEVDVDGDPSVHGDCARLVQILANLLTNASRHGRPGAALRLSASDDGEDRVRLVVAGDGDGMTRAFLAKSFEPFGQGRIPTPAGLGLGLALVRSLVELHGGHVHAHSDGSGAGGGNRIEISLPRHAAASEPAPPPAAKRDEERGAKRSDGPPRSVLVVEDDEDSAELMALALTGRGHEVRIAGDGRSALSAIEAQPPDVALIDIGLPDMDGYTLARAIRERVGGDVRLVALTGYGTETDRARSKEAGFDHHLVKPAPVADVLRVIG